MAEGLDLQRVVVASSQSAMGEGLYHCPEDGDQTPGMRPEAALRRGQWEIPCPSCGGELEIRRTPETVSNPQNAYGMSKYGEEMVALNLGRRYGIPTVALRYSIVQGPRQSVYNAYSGACRIFNLHYLLGGAPVLYEDGQAVRDYVNIHDVVDANVLAAGGRAGGRPGVQRRRRHALHDDGVRRDRPAPVRLGPSPGVVTGEYRFGDTRHIISDVAALEELGWKPRRTPVDSVAEYAAWLEGMPGLDEVLAQADAKMRALGVVRKVGRMKAFLLAAGLGTRLRPLTDRVPKCLVEIGGRPLLDIWLDALASAGVDEVLVNVHHLHHLVEEHVAARAGRPPFVRVVHEPTLLGSAGTLRANRDFVDGESFFLAINADNLTTFDIGPAGGGAPWPRTRSPRWPCSTHRGPSSAGSWRSRTASSSASRRSPRTRSGDLANAGLYAFDPRGLDLVEGDAPAGHRSTPAAPAGGPVPGGRRRRRVLPRHRHPRGPGAARGATGREEAASMIITQTPLRIGLVGGGTDLPGYYREHGGRVLNAAIDKYVYVVVKQRFDDDIYVNYSRKEIVSRVADIEHDLVREAMHMAGVRGGVEITTLADIPSAGSGLGSSSSVTVGLLHALFAYQGIQVSAEELADRACTIELERCGKPIGKQDQYAAAYGGICDLQFGPGRPRRAWTRSGCHPHCTASFQAELMLFYTGITRSADTILKEQSANVADRLTQLDLLQDAGGRGGRRPAEGRARSGRSRPRQELGGQASAGERRQQLRARRGRRRRAGRGRHRCQGRRGRWRWLRAGHAARSSTSPRSARRCPS